MTVYLQTRSGALAEHAVDLISAVNTRTHCESWHDISYHVGSEPRETRASVDAVSNYFRELAKSE